MKHIKSREKKTANSEQQQMKQFKQFKQIENVENPIPALIKQVPIFSVNYTCSIRRVIEEFGIGIHLFIFFSIPLFSFAIHSQQSLIS